MKYCAFLSLATLLLATISGCVVDVDNTPESDDEIDQTDESVAESEQELVVPGEEGQCLYDCGGGGGSPPPPPPPPPPVDTSGSNLNAAARMYLTQAGVVDAGSVGATQWVDACSVSQFQGSGTFNSGLTNSCTWANSQAGWIILETKIEVLENKNNRGSWSISVTNGPTSINTATFGSRFNGALQFAFSAGDYAASAKLDAEYQRLNGYWWKFDGTGNQVVVVVTANGGMFKSSLINVKAKAKLLRIH